MTVMKTTIVLAEMTAVSMGFGYLIGSGAMQDRQNRANNAPVGARN